MNLGVRRGRLDRAHRQPAAHVISVHRGVLQPEGHECILQPLRVAAGDGIDRHHGDSAHLLHEAGSRIERMQIRKRLSGTG